MSTISWKRPLMILVAAGWFAACSNSGGTGSTDSGLQSKCGNGVIDSNEDCDGTHFGSATCASETMGNSPAGALACDPKSCTIITTGCMAAAATGGTTGSGGSSGAGATMGSSGGATGSGGAKATGGATGSGGAKATGGTTSKDAGGDSGPTTKDAGKDGN